jgi:methylmalonyl-CoA mutase N-terminal domain/subunit
MEAASLSATRDCGNEHLSNRSGVFNAMANSPETDISQASRITNNGVDTHESERRWRERVAKLKVAPAKTSSGIELDPLYTENNIHGELGMPGEYPFTRGVQPTMYRGRLWTMRQYSGFGTASETNQRYRWLLEQGQTGISVALDLPT